MYNLSYPQTLPTLRAATIHVNQHLKEKSKRQHYEFQENSPQYYSFPKAYEHHNQQPATKKQEHEEGIKFDNFSTFLCLFQSYRISTRVKQIEDADRSRYIAQ